MMIRRLILSLVLVLFASVTIGVILGLDDAARGDLAGRLPVSDPTSAGSQPRTASRAPATAKPTYRPGSTPTARSTPTAEATAPASAKPTPRPTSSRPQPTTAPPTAAPKPTTKPRSPAPRPSVRPTSAPTSKPPAGKSTAKKYLAGPLTKGPGGTVYLTFDDGPSPYTATILATLSRTGSTATFFHLGVNEPGFPGADARIRAQGSKIGNHTYNHPDLTTLTPAQLTWQLRHGPKATCFRPPYGATDAAVRKAIAKAGMRQVLWSVDTLDWTKPGLSTLAKTGRLKAIRNGTIVLMHDGGGDRAQTVAALPTIIADLQARGFKVRALPYC